MKNIFPTTLLLLSLLCTAKLKAQNENEFLLFSQEIESPFTSSPKDCEKLDCKVEILPSIFANEARETSRVYAENKSPITGKSSLGMIPLSTFDPIVEMKIYLVTPGPINQIRLEYNSKSLKNGSGTKYAELYGSISLDNGKTYSKDSLLGIYLNVNSEVKKTSIILNGDFKNSDYFYFKLIAKRSKDSTGTAAKVIIDDIKIYGKNIPTGVENVNYSSTNLYMISQDDNFIFLNKIVSGGLYTVLGEQVAHLHEVRHLNIANWSNGVYILKTTENQTVKFIIY